MDKGEFNQMLVAAMLEVDDPKAFETLASFADHPELIEEGEGEKTMDKSITLVEKHATIAGRSVSVGRNDDFDRPYMVLVDGKPQLARYHGKDEALQGAKNLAEDIRDNPERWGAVEKSRTAAEIKREIAEVKREMKERGIPVTSMFNRQPSMEAAKYNERLFALNTELQTVGAVVGPSKIREFVKEQEVEPDNLKYGSVLSALADRFNAKFRTKITAEDIRNAVGKSDTSQPVIKRAPSRILAKHLDKSQIVTPGDEAENSIWVMTTEDLDRDGETIDPAGLDFSEFDTNPVFIDNHDTDGSVTKVILGRVVRHWLDEVGEGTQWDMISGPRRPAQMAEIKWNTATQQGREAARMAHDGMLNAGSISFLPEEGYTKRNGNGGNHYERAKLLEFTACPIGANPSALRVKSFSSNGEDEKRVSAVVVPRGSSVSIHQVSDASGHPAFAPFATGERVDVGPFGTYAEAVAEAERRGWTVVKALNRKCWVKGKSAWLLKSDGGMDDETQEYLKDQGYDDVRIEDKQPDPEDAYVEEKASGPQPGDSVVFNVGGRETTGKIVPTTGEGHQEGTVQIRMPDGNTVRQYIDVLKPLGSGRWSFKSSKAEDLAEDVKRRAEDLEAKGVDEDDAYGAALKEADVPEEMKAAVKSLAKRKAEGGEEEQLTKGEEMQKDAMQDCVSRKIEYMAKEGKDPTDPQTQAIAYSVCGEKAMDAGASEKTMKKIKPHVMKSVRKLAKKLRKGMTLPPGEGHPDAAKLESLAKAVEEEPMTHERAVKARDKAVKRLRKGIDEVREEEGGKNKAVKRVTISKNGETPMPAEMSGPAGFRAVRRWMKAIEDDVKGVENRTVLAAAERAMKEFAKALEREYKGLDENGNEMVEKVTEEEMKRARKSYEKVEELADEKRVSPATADMARHLLQASQSGWPGDEEVALLAHAMGGSGYSNYESQLNHAISHTGGQKLEKLRDVLGKFIRRAEEEGKSTDSPDEEQKAWKRRYKRLSKAATNVVQDAVDFLDDAADASDTPKRLKGGMMHHSTGLKGLIEEKEAIDQGAEEAPPDVTPEEEQVIVQAMKAVGRQMDDLSRGLYRATGIRS